jgi:arylformamidase
MRFLFCLIIVCFCFGFTSCAVSKKNDIKYIDANDTTAGLNVFTRKKGKDMPVLIFVHGGNWKTGNKDQYGFLGRNFARKGIVAVIPDYTLSPAADYNTMADQVAKAIKWSKDNIATYGGEPDNIFITGHSAGGHLAALAVMNPKYNISATDIKGIILNDAAGLDMKHYLEGYPPTSNNDYMATWSSNPKQWQDASPIYFINSNTPPFLIYVGDKTYESIKEGNERFITSLHTFQPAVKPIHINKKHVPMVLQYIWPWSPRYKEILSFINEHKN